MAIPENMAAWYIGRAISMLRVWSIDAGDNAGYQWQTLYYLDLAIRELREEYSKDFVDRILTFPPVTDDGETLSPTSRLPYPTPLVE